MPEGPAGKGFSYARCLHFARRVYPGLAAALTAALAATWLSQHYHAPVMLFALLLGLSFHFLHQEGRCVSGIELSSRLVLRTGVALLGARITVEQILGLGLTPIALVLVSVVSTLLFGLLASRALKLRSDFGLLSGGAVGICGASAALAIASVLPRSEQSERDTILTVVTVTALSTIAMIIYPMIAALVRLDGTATGIFLGGTIHDVAQVVGAGYAVSTETGDIATYVKLLRVSLLLPVVFGMALMLRQRSVRTNVAAVKPPFFLFGFAALVAARSFGLLPQTAVDMASVLSGWCLVTAIAALGMKTSFRSLLAVGWRPVVLMVAETLWIGGLVLAALLVIR